MNFLKRKTPAEDSPEEEAYVVNDAPTKSFRHAILPVIACGAGLFSDGYVNNVSTDITPVVPLSFMESNQSPAKQVIGSVSTVLIYQYGDLYTTSNAKKYVSDIAFVGTVVGQLFFGFLSDYWSRTNSLLVSTVILIIFTALAAGSYYHGDAVGMFNILTAWRFLVRRPCPSNIVITHLTVTRSASELAVNIQREVWAAQNQLVSSSRGLATDGLSSSPTA
jgi:MFS family permease